MTQTHAPSPRQDPDTRYVVARVKDVPEGSRLLVNVDGRQICIFNVEGRFHAILNRCPHRGGPLCAGDVLNMVVSERPGDISLDPSVKFIACPWHGWEFDLETGQSWYGPHDASGRRGTTFPRARRFDLQVEPGVDLESDELTDFADLGSTFVDPKTHRAKGPYAAEMYPIDVEDDYLVISLRRLPRPDAAAE